MTYLSKKFVFYAAIYMYVTVTDNYQLQVCLLRVSIVDKIEMNILLLVGTNTSRRKMTAGQHVSSAFKKATGHYSENHVLRLTMTTLKHLSSLLLCISENPNDSTLITIFCIFRYSNETYDSNTDHIEG